MFDDDWCTCVSRCVCGESGWVAKQRDMLENHGLSGIPLLGHPASRIVKVGGFGPDRRQSKRFPQKVRRAAARASHDACVIPELVSVEGLFNGDPEHQSAYESRPKPSDASGGEDLSSQMSAVCQIPFVVMSNARHLQEHICRHVWLLGIRHARRL